MTSDGNTSQTQYHTLKAKNKVIQMQPKLSFDYPVRWSAHLHTEKTDVLCNDALNGKQYMAMNKKIGGY